MNNQDNNRNRSISVEMF